MNCDREKKISQRISKVFLNESHEKRIVSSFKIDFHFLVRRSVLKILDPLSSDKSSSTSARKKSEKPRKRPR
jgi:hypothetical protein